METRRIQLTAFLQDLDAVSINAVRRKYNPVQYELINAHITVCREDELPSVEIIRKYFSQLQCTPIKVFLKKPERFDEGRGVLIPCKETDAGFQHLRRCVLSFSNASIRTHQPHITLLHPRNATCTDQIFGEILQYRFPDSVLINNIALIEQINGGKWKTLQQFDFL